MLASTLAFAWISLHNQPTDLRAILVGPRTVRAAKVLPSLLRSADKEVLLRELPKVSGFIKELDPYLNRWPAETAGEVRSSVIEPLREIAKSDDLRMSNEALRQLAKVVANLPPEDMTPPWCGSGIEVTIEFLAAQAIRSVVVSRLDQGYRLLREPNPEVFYGIAQALWDYSSKEVLQEALKRVRTSRGREQNAALTVVMMSDLGLEDVYRAAPAIADLRYSQCLRIADRYQDFGKWVKRIKPRASGFQVLLAKMNPIDPAERGKLAFGNRDPLVCLWALTTYSPSQRELEKRLPELVAIQDDVFLHENLPSVLKRNPKGLAFAKHVASMSPGFAENLLLCLDDWEDFALKKQVFWKVLPKLEKLSCTGERLFGASPAFEAEARRLVKSRNPVMRFQAISMMSSYWKFIKADGQDAYFESSLRWSIEDESEPIRWCIAQKVGLASPRVARIIFDSTWKTLSREHVVELVVTLAQMGSPGLPFLERVASSGEEQHSELATEILRVNGDSICHNNK